MDEGHVTGRSRNKGAAGERELIEYLQAQLPKLTLKRSTQAAGGTTYADIEGSPWWIECKRQVRPNIRAALQQASEASDGRVPVACTRADRDCWLLTIELTDLREFVRDAYRNIEGGET